MSAEVHDSKCFATAVPDADGAVGVEFPQWYIAVVNNRSEQKSARNLQTLGYEIYVAVQKEVHLWKGGKKKVLDRVVLPAMVFVRTTESDRKKQVVNLPFIKRFVVDPARRKDAPSPVAVIPDEQIQILRFMLENAGVPVAIGDADFRSGDHVRVIGGHLCGLEGMVHRSADGKTRLYVSLNILGFAIVEIDRRYLRHIDKK